VSRSSSLAVAVEALSRDALAEDPDDADSTRGPTIMQAKQSHSHNHRAAASCQHLHPALLQP
jgi:hypothetical protein